MNKHHPYNNIIERKLEQLPAADADLLWNDMHSILDKKMPQKKEKRRFIMWFLSSKVFLLLTLGIVVITGSSLFILSTKENSDVINKKMPPSSQPDKFIEDGTAKISQEPKESITTTTEPYQNGRDNISVTGNPISTVDHAINNNLITQQIQKQAKKYRVEEKYTKENKFSQPTQAISNASTNFDIAPVNLESIHRFLISSNLNEEKKYLNPQPEPVADKGKVKTNNRNANERGFYTGIISGVDLSSIHFKSIKTGATRGFIIGYAFNKKWSIESGLLWDTKRVYDNGTYFNPPGYTATNGITIVAVNGKSSLYELPVNMKYTIISGKHNLFTTAGLSSYIMRSENYDYEYIQNNQPGGHNYLSYKNETKNWFSVVNFSIGYTHKLGNNGSIRIEPYLKLPINNIGVGNMPIMSTGLNIGFTKPLRR